MPSRNGEIARAVKVLLVLGLVFVLVLAATTRGHWEYLFPLAPPLLTYRLESRRRSKRFNERHEFQCRLREIPGGGAGLSGRWKPGTVIPYLHRLNIRGRAAEQPPQIQLTWNENVAVDPLVQLQDVVEVSRRDPSLFQAMRFGADTLIATYRAADAVVEMAAPVRFLDGARESLHGTGLSG